VRLGALRGGIVLPVDGRWRVVTPAGRVHWLDHWVTDDGPDGPIHPNEWDGCELCGNPVRSAPICVNCSDVVRPLTWGLPNDPAARRRYEVEVFRRLPAWAQTWLRARSPQAATPELLEAR
jgi:hypothetical protein